MSPHILFVDDELPIRELLSLYFRKKGFAVTTAIDGASAKDLAQKTPFNLAIVDVNLAGESGLALLSFFRKEYPNMPVIIFTGLSGDPTLVDQALAAGACGFMRKTDSLDTLFANVVQQLPARA
jgi:two-component system, NtrC family, response regulator HydG